MMRFTFFYLLVAMAWSSATAADVRVAAAASLKDALTELGGAFEKQTGNRVILNFGASNVLARQIEVGAPVDIFFSADEAKMQMLEKNGRVIPDTRRNLLSNSLVVVISAESTLSIQTPHDIAKPAVKRLAIADPKAVPAGIYARQWLQTLGLWSAIEPKVVPAENVRAALAVVESGNAEVGIVYKTDVRTSSKVKVAFAAEAKDAPEIRYPAALIQGAPQGATARLFLEYLSSREATSVFENCGFTVLQ